MKKKPNQQPAKLKSPFSGGVLGQAKGSAIGEALDAIDGYLSDGLLYIDPVRPVVIISAELHLAYIDDEVKASCWPWRWLIRIGLIERDVRYRRLMKAVSWYLNLQRGNLMSTYEARLLLAGKDRAEAHREASQKYPIHDGPLHFIVADPTNHSQPLLLGTYDHDRIALVEASSNHGGDIEMDIA